MTSSQSSKKFPFPRIFGPLSLALFLIFQGLVWYPAFEHDYVPRQTVTASMTERGRTQPSDAIFDELRSHRFLTRDWENNQQLIATAEKLLKGRAEVPGFPTIDIHLPFAPEDLERGSGLWQLQFAGLVVPEILLDAYRINGREEFYEAARKDILAWAKYEKGAWLDRGFLWNDHAIAARVRTLADFWSVYRRRSDYRPDLAADVWSFAARSAALLSKPELYTFATNHGVMQNLALWQICLAFPSLPGVAEYRQTAFSRLKEEFSFYVGPDGTVLEHSAGYHEFGLSLFGMAMRYATLLNLDIPSEWTQKYENAKKFYAEIRRPDGSLPPFGDTGIDEKRSAVPMAEPDNAGGVGPLTPTTDPGTPIEAAWYPVSGYVVVWDGLDEKMPKRDLSQTVLVYSNFPGHGHKHADEPSVLLWAKGQDWWTNSGYWPYDDSDRSNAECWEGSNAPHLLGEKCDSIRTASLISFLQARGLIAAEVERRGPGSLAVRRLIVHAEPSIWVVADQTSGAPAQNVQTIWTAAPNISLKPSGFSNTFDLDAEGSHSGLRAYFLGPRTMKIQTFRGSHNPFAGWVAKDGEPHPADAVVTDQPADGAWAMTIWVLEDGWPHQLGDQSNSQVQWSNARSWRVRIPFTNGSRLITRDGDTISLSPGPASSATLPSIRASLNAPPAGVVDQIGALNANYQAAAVRYPRLRDLFRYRTRASAAAMAILIFQGLFLVFYRRVGGKHLTALRILAVIGWVALSFWVVLFYLRSS